MLQLSVRLSISLSVYDKVCYHDALQTTYGNFAKVTTLVQFGTRIKWLHFEIERSNLKVTA